MKRAPLVSVVFIIAASAAVTPGGPPASQPGTVLERLRAIPVLPKPHYTSHGRSAIFDAVSDETREVFRICGAVSIDGRRHFTSDQQLAHAVELAAELGVPLAMSYSPWHYPGGESRKLAATVDEVRKALWTYINEFRRIEAAALAGGVSVTAIIFDIEMWPGWRLSAAELDERDRRIAYVYWLAKATFGRDVRVVYFGHGASRYGYGDRWHTGPVRHFRFAEPRDCWGPVLYRPWAIHWQLDVLAKTAEINVRPGDDALAIVPWLSLGGGAWPTDEQADVRFFGDWTFDGPWPRYFSWQMGWILHRAPERSGPKYATALDRVDAVILYPGPGEERAPGWLPHFVAYCHGAHGEADGWQAWSD